MSIGLLIFSSIILGESNAKYNLADNFGCLIGLLKALMINETKLDGNVEPLYFGIIQTPSMNIK